MDINFFTYGKSSVNFCERDIYYLGMAEPFNVLSSFFILFVGFYGLYKVNFTTKSDEPVIKLNIIQLNILYFMIGAIGAGSVYFHSTLSPFAHWTDIICISIILIYSMYCLNSTNKIICNILSNKNFFLLLFLIHFTTSLFIPQIHIFLQFFTGFIIKNNIENKLHNINVSWVKSGKTVSIKNYLNLLSTYSEIKKFFYLALSIWIIDYFCCNLINPYHLHWIFHILIGLVAYKTINLIKYL